METFLWLPPGKGGDALAQGFSPGIPKALIAQLCHRIWTFPAGIREGGQVRIPRWEGQDVFGCFWKADHQCCAVAALWSSGLRTLRWGELGGCDGIWELI